ncbi:MAG: DsbA family protein [Pseudomonadota bacterium]
MISLLPAFLRRNLITTVLPILFLSQPTASFAEAPTPAERKAIEGVVRDYLLKNPEFLIEVLQAAEDKMNKKAELQSQKILKGRHNDIFKDPDSPSVGDKNSDVVIVEFFDYQCGFCKKVVPTLNQILQEDKKVRIIYKEFPILSKESFLAARMALAANKQGKYEPFHQALMTMNGELTEETIMATATSIGLDAAALKTAAYLPEIEAQIKRNGELAVALGVRGTPAFIVGDTLERGAVGGDALKALIAKARSRK